MSMAIDTSGKSDLSLELNALTPIWTGDAQGETSYLRATSFIGGLRFWTEALLRANGQAGDSEESADGNADLAHKIFGYTGRGRGFEMHVRYREGAMRKGTPIGREGSLNPAPCQSPDHEGRGWHFKNGLGGPFTLSIVPHARLGTGMSWLRNGLFLMLKYGALGARDQYGYGIVKADKMEELCDGTDTPQGAAYGPAQSASLRDFFFFQGLAPRSAIETPLVVRCHARKALRVGPGAVDTQARHAFCGYLQGAEKNATRFTVARLATAQHSMLLGWGWYPGPREGDRENCINALQAALKPFCPTLAWREFNSSRDTLTGAAEDWPSYWRSLCDAHWWQQAWPPQPARAGR